MEGFFLSAADVQQLKAIIARDRAGRTSERPIARRRRSPMADGGSSIRWGKVTTAIAVGSAPMPVSAHGDGKAQFYKDDGTTDGPPKDVKNPFPASFAVATGVACDFSFDPPRVVGGTCSTYA